MGFVFENFGEGELQADVAVSSTVLDIGATDAARFPSPGSGESFRATLWDGATAPEIVDCTANPGTGLLTVARAQEGTAAAAWGAGTKVRLSVTKEVLEWLTTFSVPGSPGADGKTLLNGAVDPTTEGVNGDFYINTASWKIFGPKASGAWPAGQSIVGPQGVAGATGSTGAAGAVWRYGAGVPSDSLGVNGDWYFNTSANTLYAKAAGTYGLVGSTLATAATGSVVCNLSGASAVPEAVTLAASRFIAANSSTPAAQRQITDDALTLVATSNALNMLKFLLGAAGGYAKCGTFNLTDDTAMSIDLSGFNDKSGVIMFWQAGTNSIDAIVKFRCPATTALVAWFSQANVNVVSAGGALTNGTSDGVDTKFNVSAHTDFKVYLKNRMGSNMSGGYFIIGT